MAQTDVNGKARPFYQVGRDTFDHPDWEGQTLEGVGLWSFLQAEACRTTGRRVTLMTAYKAAGFASTERIKEVFESLVASGQLVADDEPTRYRIAGWDKHQTDLTKYPFPSDQPWERAKRKREQRARDKATVTTVTSPSHEPVTSQSRHVSSLSQKTEIETTPSESLSTPPGRAAAQIDGDGIKPPPGYVAPTKTAAKMMAEHGGGQWIAKPTVTDDEVF